MDDHIPIVQHGPAAALPTEAFGVQRANILLDLELLQEHVFDGLGLALVVDGGNDEVGGNAGEFVDIQEQDVRGLSIFDDVYDLSCQGNAVQSFLLEPIA